MLLDCLLHECSLIGYCSRLGIIAFRRVILIEAMLERSHINVKVERGLALTFTRGIPYVLLFYSHP